MITIYNDPKADFIIDKANKLLVYLNQTYYSQKNADIIFQKLLDQIVYDEGVEIKIFGKSIPIPRKQTAYGDPGTTYAFSGMTVEAKPWIPLLLKIKKSVEKYTKQKYNFCLINYYEDGNDYIGYHKDDEKDLGDKPCIASLSFGQERKFYFKSDNKDLDVVKTSLPHGSLCLMAHPTNKYWKHSVPKESIKKCSQPRINLTFRWIENLI